MVYCHSLSGLKLLQAKTASGRTAIELTNTQEIAQFLKTETKLLEVEEVNPGPLTIQPDEITCEEYENILNRDKKKTLVNMQDCEDYLFLVSQLLQSYVKENMLLGHKMNGLDKACKNCKGDVECYENIAIYVDYFEKHAKLITGSQELSQICKVYLASMKQCL